jgi:hypothetical protein
MNARTPDHDFLRRLHEDGRRYHETQQHLMDRLQALLADIERTDRDSLHARVRELQAELAAREQEQAELRTKVFEILDENQRLAAQYADIERENASLASLYVAAFRLHSTLRRPELLVAVEEVIASLIGCEQFVLYERHGDKMVPIHAVGVAAQRLRPVGVGEPGILGDCVRDSSRFVRDGVPAGEAPDETALTTCIPLLVDGECHGVLNLYRLLCQKPGLEPVDHELFDLLSAHAAVALRATSASLVSHA